MTKKHDIHTEIALKKIGNKFRLLHKRNFSNYEQFAFTNNINRVQYGRYENGSDMRIGSLLKVVKGLDVSLEDFFNADFSNEKLRDN